jgi:hypothetical protein
MLLQVIRIVSLGFKYLRQSDSSSLLSLPLLTFNERYSDLGDKKFGYIIGLRPHRTLVSQQHQFLFATVFFVRLSLFNSRKSKQILHLRGLFYWLQQHISQLN